jgi:hypothetical protein
MENIEFIVRSEFTGDFYVGGWNSISFLSSSLRASTTKDLAPQMYMVLVVDKTLNYIRSNLSIDNIPRSIKL